MREPGHRLHGDDGGEDHAGITKPREQRCHGFRQSGTRPRRPSAPPPPEPFGLSLSKPSARRPREPFDRLRANGGVRSGMRFTGASPR
ncbi:hypothetical protein EZ242_12940 [Ramlibacter rhizophilus]|uniref:Uncharacterized protein n=1 Tax=Ramlibacter rhizophilus TaxID=1781167 RepID=A0A4Z0BJK0_9BURK|nr:hypothetical protein EZ242_12940 [Ramlibacter rhizophilus]